MTPVVGGHDGTHDPAQCTGNPTTDQATMQKGIMRKRRKMDASIGMTTGPGQDTMQMVPTQGTY